MNEIDSIKILIVGVKGFIGSHCENYFSKKGYDVWGADVVNDYTKEKYFLVDSTNADYFEIFQLQKFNLCINCSGAASVPDSFIHPLRDFNLNAVNVFKLLEAIKRLNSECKFINLSSAAVYGNPIALPINEDAILKPISPYGWHKQHAEMFCREFFSLYQIPTLSVRIFSVYGEGLRKQLFWDIFQRAKSESSIHLFGTGDETRDFIYVKDLVRAIEIIAQKGQFEGEALNIASGEGIKISTAATLLCNYLRKDITIQFNKIVKDGDPLFWKADISKLKSFGYYNEYTIESGLEKTAKWMIESN